jgi:hypothetical protein
VGSMTQNMTVLTGVRDGDLDERAMDALLLASVGFSSLQNVLMFPHKAAHDKDSDSPDFFDDFMVVEQDRVYPFEASSRFVLGSEKYETREMSIAYAQTLKQHFPAPSEDDSDWVRSKTGLRRVSGSSPEEMVFLRVHRDQSSTRTSWDHKTSSYVLSNWYSSPSPMAFGVRSTLGNLFHARDESKHMRLEDVSSMKVEEKLRRRVQATKKKLCVSKLTSSSSPPPARLLPLAVTNAIRGEAADSANLGRYYKMPDHLWRLVLHKVDVLGGNTAVALEGAIRFVEDNFGDVVPRGSLKVDTVRVRFKNAKNPRIKEASGRRQVSRIVQN